MARLENIESDLKEIKRILYGFQSLIGELQTQSKCFETRLDNAVSIPYR